MHKSTLKPLTNSVVLSSILAAFFVVALPSEVRAQPQMSLDPTRYYLATPVWASDYQLDISNAPVDSGSSSLLGPTGWMNNYGSCPCADPIGNPCEVHVDSGQQDIFNLLPMADRNLVLNPPDQSIPDPNGTTWGGKYLIRVPPNTPLVRVYFDVFCGAASISDGDGIPFYPIPDWSKTEFNAIQEGWSATLNPNNDPQSPRCQDSAWTPLTPYYSDRHMALYQEDPNHVNSKLYELINVGYRASDQTWHAFSGAAYNPDTLLGLHQHPTHWGGSTMCGMPISGGIVMLQELLDALQTGQPLTHGFRAVFRATAPADGTGVFGSAFVLPASNTQTEFNCRLAMPAGARFRLKGGNQHPDVEWKIAAYPAIVQLILRASQKYGIIHTDVGNGDFGIDAAYDPRSDDQPSPEGIPYGTYNPARANENLGIGRGMLVDLRYGPSGYNPNNPLIIRNSDWEMIQLGWSP